jgi:Condensation domain
MADLLERGAALAPDDRGRPEARPPQARGPAAVTLPGRPASRRPASQRPELVPIPRHLLRRRRAEIQSGPGRAELVADAGEEVYVFPTSFDQERLFFVELLEPGSAYNVPMSVPLPGPLRLAALRRAIAELGRRHEILRTTLGYLDRRPVQVVSLGSQVELEVMDLRGMPVTQRQAEAARLTRLHARQPFDLVRGPLWRAMLLSLADEDHALLLNMHHVVTDLWSTGLVVAELSALYGAFGRGEPSPLPELPLQYGDYAAWLRRILDDEATGELLGYWKTRLAGAPQALRLPADRPRPPVRTVVGDDWMFPLGEELSRRIAVLCGQQRVTLFHCLVAGLAVLLAHYADVEDLLIGSPMSNRTRPGLEALIGLFVNTVILRLEPRGQMSFQQLLQQVRATTLDAFDHQELPLGRLIDEVLEDRSPALTPLFQVMIAHQNDAMSTRPYHMGLSAAEMGEGTRVPGTTGTAKFDLVLSVMETDRGLFGSWQYSVDLFEESTIRRLGRRYRQLLEAAVEDPRRPLAELRRRIAELDRADRADRTEPAAAGSAPAAAGSVPAVTSAPAAARSAPAAAAGWRWRWRGHGAGELPELLGRLSEAEVDDLLAEVAARQPDEAVAAAIDALSAPGAVAWPARPAPGSGGAGQAAAGHAAGREAERLLARLDELSEAEVDGVLGGLLSRWEQAG